MVAVQLGAALSSSRLSDAGPARERPCRCHWQGKRRGDAALPCEPKRTPTVGGRHAEYSSVHYIWSAPCLTGARPVKLSMEYSLLCCPLSLFSSESRSLREFTRPLKVRLTPVFAKFILQPSSRRRRRNTFLWRTENITTPLPLLPLPLASSPSHSFRTFYSLDLTR